ncbi:MAG: nucleotidyl transferase AbiEii/AbiGii toxin family protein [Candidatus Curtissbacteria bacterium]|nr:nucleotidyl transferase AbiEii/AbiGii toxin family protein [Candidatus Curtissbacteria bacterium]
MISEDSIKNLTNKFQTSEINIRREYFQHLFLSYFYQQSAASNIYFKGGTALKLLYQSPRFSEDLDFNSANISYKGIEELLLDTLSQIEKENISFNLKEAKQTSGGFLAWISFEAFEKPVELKIEISLREEEKKGEIVGVINDFIPTYNVVAATETQLVFEKIRALLVRKKPRDFYDLYFLLRKGLPIPKRGELIPQITKALDEKNFNFEVELKEFLPRSQWAIIKDFKTTLEREINRFT